MSVLHKAFSSISTPSGTKASPRQPGERAFSLEDCNPAVLNAQYAVRGEIPIRAEELRQKIEKGENVGFEKVINCNIGNPQQLGQKPLTFLRQVSFESGRDESTFKHGVMYGHATSSCESCSGLSELSKFLEAYSSDI
jgi:hypothetical protein